MSMRRTQGGPARTLLAPGLLGVLVVLASCGQGEVVGAEPTPPTEAPTGAPTAPPTGPEDDMSRTPEPLEPPVSGLPGAELPADPAGAELVLLVGTAESPLGSPVTLGCDWRTGTVSGDHPQGEQACADLRAALGSGNPFTPVPPDAMCTQVYGGDAVVEVFGVVQDSDGAPVDVAARFTLTDGCQIDRWEAMGAVLSPYGGPGGVSS